MSTGALTGGTDALDLATGELRFATPAWIREVLERTARDVSLRYATSDEQQSAVDAYRRFRHHATAGSGVSVTLTAGAKEGIWLALWAALDRPGQTVLLPEPAWRSYRRIADRLGATVSTYRVEQSDESWVEPLVASLRRLRPSTVVLNFPHNPTGAVLAQPELDAIVDAASAVKAVIISDEVYLPFGPSPASLADARYQGLRRIVVDSASKWLALAGLRVGWVTADGGIQAELSRLRSGSAGTTISSLGQLGVQRILEDPRCSGYVDDLVSSARRCVTEVGAHVEARGDRVVGDGPVYVWAQAPQEVTGPVLLGGKPTSVAPGSQFGAPACFYRLCPGRQALLDGGRP